MNTFDQFWAAYPRRVAKHDAQKAWIKLNPSTELVTLMLTAINVQHLERMQKIERRQWVPEWPYPASWLRGARWEDQTPLVDSRQERRGKEDELRQFREDMQRQRELRESR